MKKRGQTTRFKRKRLIYSFNTFKKYFELCFTPTAFIRSDSTTMWQQWTGLPEKVKAKVNSLVVFIHLILLRIIARPVFFSPSTFCSDPPCSTKPPCLAREHLTLRLRPLSCPPYYFYTAVIKFQYTTWSTYVLYFPSTAANIHAARWQRTSFCSLLHPEH